MSRFFIVHHQKCLGIHSLTHFPMVKSLCSIVFPWFFHHVSGLFGLHGQVDHHKELMFVSQMAFFAHVSDPAFGGARMNIICTVYLSTRWWKLIHIYIYILCRTSYDVLNVLTTYSHFLFTGWWYHSRNIFIYLHTLYISFYIYPDLFSLPLSLWFEKEKQHAARLFSDCRMVNNDTFFWPQVPTWPCSIPWAIWVVDGLPRRLFS